MGGTCSTLTAMLFIRQAIEASEGRVRRIRLPAETVETRNTVLPPPFCSVETTRLP